MGEQGRQVKGARGGKGSRTPAQQKLDSQLFYALKQRRGETQGVPADPIQLELDEDGRVLVDISANVTPRVLAKIRKLGGSVLSKFEKYHTIRARLPLEKLEALATLEDVRFVTPAAEGMTSGGAANN